MGSSTLAIRMFPEDLRSTAFGGIGVNYTMIGDPFENPIRILKIQNLTDVTLLFSWNGVDDHDVLPSAGFTIFDVTANKTIDQGCFFAQEQGIWVKQSGVPSVGSVYVTAFYAIQL